MPKAVSADISLVREIRVHWQTDGNSSSSRASDISVTGAFINTPDPLPKGTTLDLRLETAGREIAAQAIVRRVIPGEGMGVEFQSMSGGDQACLEGLVRQASGQDAPPVADSGAPPASDPAQPSAHTRNSSERRARARYKFSAPAEITEAGTGAAASGQLSNLGPAGCYVKIDSPFAPGASVEVRLTHEGQSFRARAAVKGSDASSSTTG